jgi:hypothetical protein
VALFEGLLKSSWRYPAFKDLGAGAEEPFSWYFEALLKLLRNGLDGDAVRSIMQVRAASDSTITVGSYVNISTCSHIALRCQRDLVQWCGKTRWAMPTVQQLV